MARSITGVAQHRLKKPTIGLSKIGCEVQAVASPHGESGRNLAVRMSHQRRIWTVSATAVAWIHGGTGRHFANRTSHQPRTWTVPATAVLGFKGGAGRYFTDRTSHQRRIGTVPATAVAWIQGWGRPILRRPDVAPAPHRDCPCNCGAWIQRVGPADTSPTGRRTSAASRAAGQCCFSSKSGS